MVGGNVHFYLKLSAKITYSPCKNGDFQSMFACSTSAVTPSKNSSIVTNMKSTKGFPMSLDEQHKLPLSPPPKGGSKRKVTVFVPNLNN